MAKKEKKEQDKDTVKVVMPNEAPETEGMEIVEDVETDVEDDLEVKVVVNTAPKDVTIHVTDNIDNIVGGVFYSLKRDKDYKVPSDVASILCNAGYAYRI